MFNSNIKQPQRIATKPQTQYTKRHIINPYDEVLNTPNGIALALGAKIATKCDKILNADMILLLTHLFGDSENAKKHDNIDDIYQAIVMREKDKFFNIDLLCVNLKDCNVSFDDKIEFIKSLLLISFDSEIFNDDDIIFKVALSIGVDSRYYFSLKKELEKHLIELSTTQLVESNNIESDIMIDIKHNVWQSEDSSVDIVGSNKDINLLYYTKHNLMALYKILDVSPDDTNETIKKQYRYLVTKYHPDKYTSKDLPADVVKFAKGINDSYNAIKKHRGMS